MITDKEFEQYIENVPVRQGGRIGSKKAAIEALKNLGWGKYDMDTMREAFNNDGGCPIFRVGRTYYWRGE